MGMDRAATYSCTACALNSHVWWLQVGSRDDGSKCRGRKFQAVWNVLRGVSIGRSWYTHVWKSCVQRQAGAAQRDSVPSDTPGLDMSVGTCCRFFSAWVMWLSDALENGQSGLERSVKTAAVCTKAHLKVLPLPGLPEAEGGPLGPLFQKHFTQLHTARFMEMIFFLFLCLSHRMSVYWGWGVGEGRECLKIIFLLFLSTNM